MRNFTQVDDNSFNQAFLRTRYFLLSMLIKVKKRVFRQLRTILIGYQYLFLHLHSKFLWKPTKTSCSGWDAIVCSVILLVKWIWVIFDNVRIVSTIHKLLGGKGKGEVLKLKRNSEFCGRKGGGVLVRSDFSQIEFGYTAPHLRVSLLHHYSLLHCKKCGLAQLNP